MRLALLFLLPASAALAETPMRFADFETWSTGKTLVYDLEGSIWGREMHLSGRRTVDADDGGVCRSGRWYPQGDDICFVYDDSPGPYCWRFLLDGSRVFAEALSDPSATRFAVTLSDSPIPCPDPEVGV